MSAPSPPPPAGALRIGGVAGVPIYLDRTWLVLALLVAWTGWQAGQGLDTGTQVAYALWLVVGILVAVLGHEVGHALVARGLGFRVHRVVATLLGGHTAYDGTGATAARTAAVAVAGPAANLLLAGLGALAAAAAPWPVSLFGSAFAWMNLLLAGFNLLPGLPLDGGAVVQSLVWGVTGRRDLGLVVAGWGGRVLAVGIVLWFGVRPVLLGSPRLFDLLISLVMGWILWQGGTAALRRARVERLLRLVRPEQVLEPVHVVPAPTPVGELVGAPHRIVALDERGRPCLVLPTREAGGPDLATLPPHTRLDSLVVRVPDECLVDLAPEGDLEPVLRAMGATGWGLVVVSRAGAVQGVVTSQRLDAAARQALGHS
jgi:Zn-dependent protease